jgi:hypothetical protein
MIRKSTSTYIENKKTIRIGSVFDQKTTHCGKQPIIGKNRRQRTEVQIGCVCYLDNQRQPHHNTLIVKAWKQKHQTFIVLYA